MFRDRKKIWTILVALPAALTALPATAQQQDTVYGYQVPTDTTYDATTAVDTVAAEGYEPDSITSDAATNYTALEDRVRNGNHALYDTSNAPEGAHADIDYASRWPRNLGDDAREKMLKDKALNYNTRESKPSAFIVGLQALLANLFMPSLYLLLFATLVLVVLYILQSNEVQLFRRKSKQLPEVAEAPAAQQDEDVATGNFEGLLQQAVAAGNWTAATRYLYLYTLQQMHHKGLLRLGQHKTNYDYLTDVRNTRWYKPFSLLTLDYEYVCYGHFELSGADFEKIHAHFNAFKQDLQQS